MCSAVCLLDAMRHGIQGFVVLPAVVSSFELANTWKARLEACEDLEFNGTTASRSTHTGATQAVVVLLIGAYPNSFLWTEMPEP